MFGLVKQNYELPKEVLQHTGIDIFELDTFELDTFELDTFELDTFELDEFIPDSFSIVPLKRGIIGVLEIGYI